MNRQAYSILFCVLFASSFIHEIKAKAAANPEFARVRRAITNPKPSPIDDNISLNITAVTSNILSICNVEAKLYLLLDISTNIAILLNGNTTKAVIIDVKAKTAVSVQDIDVWEVLEALEDGLEAALKRIGGNDVIDNLLEAVNDVIIYLVPNIGEELKVNLALGLELIIDISRELIEILKGDLNGLLKHIRKVEISTEMDLVGFLHFLLGLEKCIGTVPGGVGTISKTLNLQVLLNLSNGLEVLLALIGQLGVHARTLTFLNDLEAFFLVVALLGGVEDASITGLSKVLLVIVRFIKGKDSLEMVTTVLIEVLARWGQSKPVPDVVKVTRKMLHRILSLLEKLCLTKDLGGLVTNINYLLDRTLTFGGVKLSAIITLLLKIVSGKASSVMESLVGVLILLEPIVNNEVAFVRGLLTLLFHLTTTIGRQLLKSLGCGVDSVLGVVEHAIANLIKSAGDILSLLLENLYEALLKIPIIRDIVKLLADVIKSVTGGKIDLKDLLNNPSHKVVILGLIQVETGLPLKINAYITLQIKIVLNYCTNIAAYRGFSYPEVLGPRQC